MKPSSITVPAPTTAGPANLALPRCCAFLQYDPSDKLAAIINGTFDIALDSLIKDDPIRLEQVILLPRIQPPTFQDRTVHDPAFVHDSLDCVRDF